MPFIYDQIGVTYDAIYPTYDGASITIFSTGFVRSEFLMGLIGSPTTFEHQILTALQTSTFKTALATTEFRLFKNNFVPGPGTVFADFTEADFTGYGAVTSAAWSAPTLDAVSGRYFVSPTAIPGFTQSGVVTTNTIYGFYLEDGSSNLIAFERFDTPIEMDTTGKNIQILPKINAAGLEGGDALED